MLQTNERTVPKKWDTFEAKTEYPYEDSRTPLPEYVDDPEHPLPPALTWHGHLGDDDEDA